MKKYRSSLVLMLLFLMGNVALSQDVKIKGKVNEPEALIRLMTYNDMLTCEQTTVFETSSDENGSFSIETKIDDIVMAQIAVNLERVDILLKPDADYEIEIHIPEQEKDISYFERQSPTLKIIKSNDDELYYQYNMSNVIIDDFVLDNFNRLYRNRQLSLLDTLDVKIENILGDMNTDFVKDNILYRKAAIIMMTGNANKVLSQYFNKQPVLYSQPAYMNLFQEIFTNYLTSRQFDPSELRAMLYDTYDNFLKFIKGKDAFLSDNHDLAELIVAWNLKRMYYEMPDDRNRIYAYLNYIYENAGCSDNKEVIGDIIRQINRLSFNSDAPDFVLKDGNDKDVRLSDFKDKMILLQFVNQRSSMTDYQFEMLKDLSQQWHDTIQIITIATKESFVDFRSMFDEKNYRWTLLDLGDDILLLENYQIMTYPDYVILGKDNKIGMAPAPAPDQYLDFHVRRIYNYYKK